MDLKVYYRKIREVEAEIAGADVVVVSLETPDGGRAGVRSEVPAKIAAKLLVEGRVRLASDEEAAEHRENARLACEKALEEAAAKKLQVAIVSEPKPRSPRASKQQK